MPPPSRQMVLRKKAHSSSKRARLFAWAVIAMMALHALSAPRAPLGPFPRANQKAGREVVSAGGHSLRGATLGPLQEGGETGAATTSGRNKSGNGGDGGGAIEGRSTETENEKEAPTVAAPAREQEGNSTASASVEAEVAANEDGTPVAEDEREVSTIAEPAEEQEFSDGASAGVEVATNEEGSPAAEKEWEAPTDAAPTQDHEASSTAYVDAGAVANAAEGLPPAEKEAAESPTAAMPTQGNDGKNTDSANVRIEGRDGESAPSDEKRGHARTVGVAVTLTDCVGFPPDGASVVQYSVMKHQKLKSLQGSPSRYQYHFYAIYHPSAKECALPLADLNYTLLERNSPVFPQDIREGSDLRNDISRSGCCGEKELIKFEAFNLVQHDAVILLDVDALVLKSLDQALDLLLDRTIPAEDPASHIMFHPERPIPDDVWLLYTGDYEIVAPETWPKPTQGGFTIFKPNRTIYNAIVDIVREGQWSRQFGWGTKESHTTNHWGSQTFQGLMPYYFFILNPGHSIELNGCQYNTMNTRPIRPDQDPMTTNVTSGWCLTDRDECEDCRDRKLVSLSSFHFTACKKPWRCSDPLVPAPGQDHKQQLCHEATQAWFDYRSEMERSWGRKGRGSHWTTGNKTLSMNHWGYCSWFRDDPKTFHGAASEYDQIRLPYGHAAIDAATDESR